MRTTRHQKRQQQPLDLAPLRYARTPFDDNGRCDEDEVRQVAPQVELKRRHFSYIYRSKELQTPW